ncbi:MAG: HAD hydrolase family protein [Streptococcus sp.]
MLVAFGDGDNDIELLRMAGSFLCDGKCQPCSLQVADQVAPHHKGSRGLDYLRRLFRFILKKGGKSNEVIFNATW